MFSDGFRDMDSHDTTKMPQMSDTEEERHYTNDTDAPLYEPVIGALSNIFDPEIPVNIVDLGLVYECKLTPLDDGKQVDIKMTLTAPGCGMGDILVEDVRAKVERVPTVVEADVELVFDPPWNQTLMSDVARLETGML